MTLVNKQIHIPVLLEQTIKSLNINKEGTYLDATAGFGGHSQEILNRLSKNGKLICIDQDLEAIDFLKNKFKNHNNVEIINSNFANLQNRNIEALDGVLMDLGVSSKMFDDANRGFSYKLDGPLDMRMDQNSNKLTAKDIVNNYSLNQLVEIFNKYGEAKKSYVVAKKIVSIRNKQPIETTLQLSEIICSCFNKSQKHPAKQFFQALRIEVNDELNVLKQAIKLFIEKLKINGILAIITFHSLEDRIVKNFFSMLTNTNDIYQKENPNFQQNIPEFQLLTKKPIIADQDELEKNNRSHSAKLRVLKKIR